MTNTNENRKKLSDKKNRTSKKNNKKIFTIPLSIILLLSSILILGFNVYNHSYFKISQVFVDGNVKIEDQKILEIMGSPIEKSILTYKSNKYKKILEEEKNIQQADIEKEYPDKIKVKIKEIYPFLSLEVNDKRYIVSNTGEIMDYENKEDGLNLIEYKGKFSNLESSKKFTNNKELLIFLERLQTYSYAVDISQLNFEKASEIGIIIKDIQIKFGDLKNIDYKLKLLDSVLKDIEEKEILASKIDLTKGNNPIVEVEDEQLNQEDNE